MSISLEHSRSWLLMSGLANWGSAQGAGPDQVVVDLEDGVPATRRIEARERLSAQLSTDRPVWVRISPAGTADWARDLDVVRDDPAVAGIVLAKTEGPDDVARTCAELDQPVPIIALIESAMGIESAIETAAVSGVSRLAFGSGDYRRDTGASAADIALSYPRTKLVLASRIGGLPGPIDGPSPNAEIDEIRRHAQVAVSLGMTGKICLAVNTASAINEEFSPTSNELDWAQSVLAEFRDNGGTIRDGSDLPRLSRAEKIHTRAEALGMVQLP